MNSHFQFKQFRIDQGACAMKVCTDSCILGAYAHYTNPERILDIGTGTGLLALMIAQKSNCAIDAVEIDQAAAQQAQQNFNSSKWSTRLTVYQQGIQEFSINAQWKYDLIVSNPPFFKNHLKSPKDNKNTAHHNDSLPFEELALSTAGLLSEEGLFFVLLPRYESEVFMKVAQDHSLYPLKHLKIFNSEEKPVFRIISVYAFKNRAVTEDILIIKNREKCYTTSFKNLLKEYYLIF